MSEKIMLYGTPACGMVPPVRSVLDRAGASYEYVDISRDDVARQRVREINKGLESVPTLEFPDGDTFTEPALRELEEKLADLGLQVGPLDSSDWLALLLVSPAILVVAVGLGLVGLLGRQPWLIVLGLTILVLGLVASWRRKGRS